MIGTYIDKHFADRVTSTVVRVDDEYMTTGGVIAGGLHPTYLSGPQSGGWCRAWCDMEEMWAEGVAIDSDQALFVAKNLGKLPEGLQDPRKLRLRTYIASGSSTFRVDPITICRPTLVKDMYGKTIWEGDILETADTVHPCAVGIVCENTAWRERNKELRWWWHRMPSAELESWPEWEPLYQSPLPGCEPRKWRIIGSIRENYVRLNEWDGTWYKEACPDDFV